jgi:site-specific recombinase XerD
MGTVARDDSVLGSISFSWPASCRIECCTDDLRHSTGSILFAQGVRMKVIQMVLRHSQIGTTMNTYVHLRSEGLSEAKAAMERALG